jgi:hypothetical protein
MHESNEKIRNLGGGGRIEEKRSLRIPRHRREDYIKIDHTKK